MFLDWSDVLAILLFLVTISIAFMVGYGYGRLEANIELMLHELDDDDEETSR